MYELAKSSVQADIYTNSDQLITGNVLQNTLVSMISALGENSGFMGIATPGNGATIDAGDQKVWYICINNTASVISYPRYIGGTTTNLSPGGVAILYHTTSTSGWSWANLTGNANTANSILGKIAAILATIGDNLTPGSIIYRISALEGNKDDKIALAMDRGIHMAFQGSIGDTAIVCKAGEADIIVFDGEVISGNKVTLTDTNEHHAFLLPKNNGYAGELISSDLFSETENCIMVEYSQYVKRVEDTGIVAGNNPSLRWIFLGMTPPFITDPSSLDGFGGMFCHDAAYALYYALNNNFEKLDYQE